MLLSNGCCVLSCSNEDNPLVPYISSTQMSGINIEQGSFNPEVTWLGGYSTVFGVNKGTEAILDSSLVWLVYTSGNQLRFPIKYGELPQGTQDLTQQYGGTKINSLSEDNTYTFWVMKEDAWNLAKNSNSKFVPDSLSTAIVETGDSLKITNKLYAKLSLPLDVFINIYGISTFGRLADININTDLSNSPVVSWTIKQTGVTDPKISAIGITEGGQYTPTQTVWETYSITVEDNVTSYGKKM